MTILMKDIDLQFSSFVLSSGLGIRLMLASTSIFWKRLYRIGINFSLNIWQNSPLKLPRLRDHFFISFKIMHSIFLIITGLFK